MDFKTKTQEVGANLLAAGATLQSHAAAAGATLQSHAAAAGASLQENAAWATAKTLEKGSAAYDSASVALKEKVRAEYGGEVFDMMEALNTCTDGLATELETKKAKYGIPMALPLLTLLHTDLPTPASKGEVKDLALVNDVRYWLDYAAGAYGSTPEGREQQGDDVASVQKGIGSQAKVKLASLPAAGVQCPGHFVAVDSAKKCVVLGVRGTSTLSDAITDAVGESVALDEMSGVKVHKAMLASARMVLTKTRPAIDEALAANRGYSLLVTGHSLGAGTAILCSLLLSANPPNGKPELTCYAYAPPPVVAPVQDPQVKAVKIFSFVNRFDAVPRASLGNVFHLGQECMAIDKLDLTLLERLGLIHRGSADNAAEKEKVNKVCSAARAVREKAAKETHPRFPNLFVPGEVFWFEWPEQGKQKMHRTEATELNSILLRGGVTALKDHLCSNYQAAIDGAKAGIIESKSLCGLGCTIS